MEKAVWVVAGGAMQVPLIRELKKMGLALVVSDGDSECEAAALADIFLEIDTFDAEAHIQASQEVSRVLKILAVITVAADCHETVSIVAEAMDLPGIPSPISRLLRRKDLFRAAIDGLPVLQPRYLVAGDIEEARAAASRLGSSYLLKATDNSGSRGMTAFREGEEIHEDAYLLARNSGTSGLVLVEEALQPDQSPSEISVETLWLGGKMIILNSVHRLFRNDLESFSLHLEGMSGRNWGVEVGHINPAKLSDSQAEKVRLTMECVGNALGFSGLRYPAILKGDLMHTNGDIAVLEATPRLSGGWDSSGTTLMRGANFQKGFAKLLLGYDSGDVLASDFSYSRPELFAAAMSESPPNALDSIGRVFGLGSGTTAEEAIVLAARNLSEEIN